MVKYNHKLYSNGPKFLMALWLSLVFQSCNSTPVGQMRTRKTTLPRFQNCIENLEDISEKKHWYHWIESIESDILYASVDHNDCEVVRTILQRMNQDKKEGKVYTTPDFPNHIGKNKTSLGRAISWGNADMVNALLENEHININKVNSTTLTSLVHALKHAYGCNGDAIPELLIQNKVQRLKQLDITSKDPVSDDTPLHIAISKNLRIITELLIPKLDKKALCEKGNKNKTPLHLAAYYGKLGLIRGIFNRIVDLTSQEEAIEQLFTLDSSGHSVFARIFHCNSNRFATSLTFKLTFNGSKETTLFIDVLSLVSRHLTDAQWDAILKEINNLKSNLLLGDARKILQNTVYAIRSKVKEVKEGKEVKLIDYEQ